MLIYGSLMMLTVDAIYVGQFDPRIWSIAWKEGKVFPEF